MEKLECVVPHTRKATATSEDMATHALTNNSCGQRSRLNVSSKRSVWGSRELLSFMLMESGSRPHGHVKLKVLIRPRDGGDGGSRELWRERHNILLVSDNVNFFMLMANYSELIILNIYYCWPSYCLWIFIISLEIKTSIYKNIQSLKRV